MLARGRRERRCVMLLLLLLLFIPCLQLGGRHRIHQRILMPIDVPPCSPVFAALPNLPLLRKRFDVPKRSVRPVHACARELGTRSCDEYRWESSCNSTQVYGSVNATWAVGASRNSSNLCLTVYVHLKLRVWLASDGSAQMQEQSNETAVSQL
jgi:hypothetical protein